MITATISRSWSIVFPGPNTTSGKPQRRRRSKSTVASGKLSTEARDWLLQQMCGVAGKLFGRN